MAALSLAALAFAIWIGAERAQASTPAVPDRGGVTAFSGFIDDLPIMPGLAEDEDGYAFDLSEGGRLAEARLAGDAEVAVVRGFYAATLTQLGWRPSDTEPYVYYRNRERLIFLIEPSRRRAGARPPKGLEAVFVVTPLARLADGKARPSDA